MFNEQEYHRNYMRMYRAAGKENPVVVERYRNKYYKETYQARRVFLDSLKSVPCADCGIQYPSYVMQFDHKGNKEFQIGTNTLLSEYRLKLEIAKCDVVCANCHAERTHKRRNGSV